MTTLKALFFSALRLWLMIVIGALAVILPISYQNSPAGWVWSDALLVAVLAALVAIPVGGALGLRNLARSKPAASLVRSLAPSSLQ